MTRTIYLGMIDDIIHPGLINIINEGAKHGDLMVGLFTDRAITSHKRLPYLIYDQRKNVVEKNMKRSLLTSPNSATNTNCSGCPSMPVPSMCSTPLTSNGTRLTMRMI